MLIRVFLLITTYHIDNVMHWCTNDRSCASLLPQEYWTRPWWGLVLHYQKQLMSLPTEATFSAGKKLEVRVQSLSITKFFEAGHTIWPLMALTSLWPHAWQICWEFILLVGYTTWRLQIQYQFLPEIYLTSKTNRNFNHFMELWLDIDYCDGSHLKYSSFWFAEACGFYHNSIPSSIPYSKK